MTKETRKRTAETPGTSSEREGRNPRRYGDGASSGTVRRENSHPGSMNLMEAVVERENMWEAYRKVVGNKGAGGVDEMTVEELKPYLQKHWPETREKLVNGSYQPQPVLGVEIPKPGGGMRKLGIPTVLDRLIQQALLQVLSPLFDPNFSESSYGFRPGKSAHQAVLKAREHVMMTRRWVVDIDLEKFFDRVNHDILMSRVARKVKDQRVLRLIRRYLQAGIMADGIITPSRKGTPQGGNLSPLLSNILLDELDKELERRGHTFCRYADDCNIYVRSKRAGERVYASITRFLENRLQLRVNGDKSAIDRPWKRKFLGYSMTWHMKPKLRVAEESVARFKEKLREQFRRGRGRNVRNFIEELRPLLIGWINYFSLAEVKGTFEDLDGWIRRKLRAIIWRQWKRKFTRRKNLMKRGLSEEQASKSAYNGRGAWWNAGASHMNLAFPKRYFDTCGLISLLDLILDFQRSL
jgi:RNA-directed DNA polymerase